jgi:hypothetical protein
MDRIRVDPASLMDRLGQDREVDWGWAEPDQSVVTTGPDWYRNVVRDRLDRPVLSIELGRAGMKQSVERDRSDEVCRKDRVESGRFVVQD